MVVGLLLTRPGVVVDVCDGGLFADVFLGFAAIFLLDAWLLLTRPL